MNRRKTVLNVIGLVILPLAIIGTVDIWTGPHVSLSFFYLIPIAFAALLGGYKGGVACSLAASAIFFYEQLAGSSGVGLALWNAAMRLLTLLVVGIFLPIAVDSIRKTFGENP